MRYGIPYQGSKNRLAGWITGQLPAADTFVDLFAGGCAVTHAAMLSGKWRQFIANDIKVQYPQLFKAAAQGKYRDGGRVVTREEFNAIKGHDAYAATVWSFGNNMRSYLWSADKVAVKIPACRMLLAPTFGERYKYYRQFVNELLSRLPDVEGYTNLQGLEGIGRLARLESLERLQGMECLKCLEITGLDYRDVVVPRGATVYADPPYSHTEGLYVRGFDHEAFYEWLRGVGFPVFVSEYSMPEDFLCVGEKDLFVHLSATNNRSRRTERIYVHRRFEDYLKRI